MLMRFLSKALHVQKQHCGDPGGKKPGHDQSLQGGYLTKRNNYFNGCVIQEMLR
jgi:hypothetical protein